MLTVFTVIVKVGVRELPKRNFQFYDFFSKRGDPKMKLIGGVIQGVT